MHSLRTPLPELIYGAGGFADSPVHSCHAAIHVTEQDRNATQASSCLMGKSANYQASCSLNKTNW